MLAATPALNFHLLRPCDAACRFCFATFRDVDGQLSLAEARRLLALLREAGAEKLNFAGGEPTLHRHLGDLLHEARALGFVTSIVTNGFRLGWVLDKYAADLDWVGLSVDTPNEATAIAIGRSKGDQIQRCIELAERCHGLGIRVKLNTVVCALNQNEDLSPLVRAIRPARWKVLQALPMAGQNDDQMSGLEVSTGQFDAFVQRHAHLAAEGFAPVVEDNDHMRGAYLMIDPIGRFFGNATGQHRYSAPILEVGVEAALAQVGFLADRFFARGGLYAW